MHEKWKLCDFEKLQKSYFSLFKGDDLKPERLEMSVAV